jgi:hypothetical protein
MAHGIVDALEVIDVSHDERSGPPLAPAARTLSPKDDWALFVGQWPAACLLMGVYNKMVKQHGSDAYSEAA